MFTESQGAGLVLAAACIISPLSILELAAQRLFSEASAEVREEGNLKE
jgi:hypothetical protein